MTALVDSGHTWACWAIWAAWPGEPPRGRKGLKPGGSSWARGCCGGGKGIPLAIAPRKAGSVWVGIEANVVIGVMRFGGRPGLENMYCFLLVGTIIKNILYYWH